MMEIATPSKASSARSEGLALALDEGTRKSHSVAENTQFVTGFFKGIANKKSFAQLVASLYFVYEAMEKAFDENEKINPNIAALDYQELRRLKTLEEDMVYYFGDSWKTTVKPSKATQKYVGRIAEIAKTDPSLLIAHMYTRYLGDLFGGQMMGGMARSSLSLEPGFGTQFYQFDDIIDSKAFIENWYVKLNSLDLDSKQQQAIVDEGNLVFRYNIDLFNELEGGKRDIFNTVLGLLKVALKKKFK